MFLSESIFWFYRKLQLCCRCIQDLSLDPAASPFLRMCVNYKKNSKYTFLQTISIVFPANSSSILLYFIQLHHSLSISSIQPPSAPNALDFLQAFPIYFIFIFFIPPAVYILPMPISLRISTVCIFQPP